MGLRERIALLVAKERTSKIKGKERKATLLQEYNKLLGTEDVQIPETKEIVHQLLDALTLARQYVAATHGTIAQGHEDTVVKPDLDKIDSALAEAKIILDRLGS